VQYPDLTEFGLIGNDRLLISTSVFSDFINNRKEGEKSEILKTKSVFRGDEFTRDRGSLLMIGFALRNNIIKWPWTIIDSEDPNEFIILYQSGNDIKFKNLG
jgi:hypothetical protein